MGVTLMNRLTSFMLTALVLLFLPACSQSQRLAKHWGAVFTEMDKFPALAEHVSVGEQLVSEHRIRVRGYDYDKIIAEESEAADAEAATASGAGFYTISEEIFNDRYDAVLYTTSITCKHMEMTEEETRATLQPVFDVYLSEVEDKVGLHQKELSKIQERMTVANSELTAANLAFSELLSDLSGDDSPGDIDIDDLFKNMSAESAEESDAAKKAIKHAKRRVEKAQAQVAILEAELLTVQNALASLGLQRDGLNKTAERLGLGNHAEESQTA